VNPSWDQSSIARRVLLVVMGAALLISIVHTPVAIRPTAHVSASVVLVARLISLAVTAALVLWFARRNSVRAATIWGVLRVLVVVGFIPLLSTAALWETVVWVVDCVGVVAVLLVIREHRRAR
jgi:hypothetical protein